MERRFISISFNLRKIEVMKRVYIAMAVLVTASLASCQREESFEQNPIGKDALAFTIQDISTKSAESAAPIRKGNTYSLGKDDEGTPFFLEETITDLNEVSPATKGTPVYTSNVNQVYSSLKAVGYQGSTVVFPEATFESMDTEKNGGWLYTHDYGKSLWPADNSDVYFFLQMPSDATGVTMDTETPYNASTGEIKFHYQTPGTGSAQQDILFASRTLNKSQYESYFNGPNNGAPVLFRHALTGVKFATANHIAKTAEGTKTYITKVTIKNLKSSATCVFKPTGTETDRDNTSEYSSAGSVKWTFDTVPVDNPEEGEETGEEIDPVLVTGTFSQTFDESNYASNIYQKHNDYETENGKNDGYFPDSFYAEDKVSGIAGKKTTDWNINDEDGSLTFWFIPQQLTDDVKLEIEFYIDAGSAAGGKKSDTIIREIDFGTLSNHANWKAGQLRTYVLKATEVAVIIEDQMTSATTKEMVQVRNMGNVPEWVRSTVVANWCVYMKDDKYVSTSNPVPEGQIAFNSADIDSYESVAVYGYTADTGDTFVTPWDLATEIGSSPQYGNFYVKSKAEDGTVTETAGFGGNGWVLNTQDGYYYYTNYIGVDEAATNNLFSKYIVNTNNIPTVYMLDRSTMTRTKVDVHLEMDVVVQAILADVDETTGTVHEGYEEAWAKTK